MNIKETKEFIEMLGLLAVMAKRISKDGLTLSDLSELITLANNFDVVLDGAKGLDVMLEELKDLDQAEILAIISALYEQAKLVNEA